MKVRKTLTEILLDVTDQEIESTAKEAVEEAKRKSVLHSITVQVYFNKRMYLWTEQCTVLILHVCTNTRTCILITEPKMAFTMKQQMTTPSKENVLGMCHPFFFVHVLPCLSSTLPTACCLHLSSWVEHVRIRE